MERKEEEKIETKSRILFEKSKHFKKL